MEMANDGFLDYSEGRVDTGENIYDANSITSQGDYTVYTMADAVFSWYVPACIKPHHKIMLTFVI